MVTGESGYSKRGWNDFVRRHHTLVLSIRMCSLVRLCSFGLISLLFQSTLFKTRSAHWLLLSYLFIPWFRFIYLCSSNVGQVISAYPLELSGYILVIKVNPPQLQLIQSNSQIIQTDILQTANLPLKDKPICQVLQFLASLYITLQIGPDYYRSELLNGG